MARMKSARSIRPAPAKRINGTARPVADFRPRDSAPFWSTLGCRSGNRKGREVIMLKHRPTFEISESKDGGYLVLLTWPKGSEQQVDGFASVEAARAWIEDDAPSWIAASKCSR